MPEITVHLPENAYSIHIEPGVLANLGDHVRRVAPHARCLLAMDANVVEPHGSIAKHALEDAGYEVVVATLIADEKHKTLASVDALYRVMLAAKLERKSPVIALGGGIVGDVAGYAAATYLRGVPLIQVPTTLLAMVDAAIGGKTGVNFPLPDSNDLGKNLIGAFWQPKAVIVDPQTLRTLPPREFRCGLAECVKHAAIADGAMLFWLQQQADAILALRMETIVELIERSATIKAEIVAEDEREAGRRALLNLGHTFAHAIESIAELDVRHGEAVATGLVAALHVATSLKRMNADDGEALFDALVKLDLPVLAADGVSIDRLMHAMTFDKKVEAGQVRLVLPLPAGGAELVDDVPEEFVREAWRAVGAVD